MSRKNMALICAALALVLAAVLVVLLIKLPHGKAAADTQSASEELTVEVTALPDAPEVTPNSNPVVSANDAPVSDSYFDDALFIGDSLVKGLETNDYDDILAGADFLTDDEMTLMGCTGYLGDLEYDVYGKVYISLGIDELLYDDDDISNAFEDIISEVRRYEPNAVIYLMSLPPVSEYHSSVSYTQTRENVQEFNNIMRAAARENGAYYLNVYSALCDEDGYLPSEVTVDGIHFTPAHYAGWYDYLLDHYVTGNTDAEDWDE